MENIPVGHISSVPQVRLCPKSNSWSSDMIVLTLLGSNLVSVQSLPARAGIHTAIAPARVQGHCLMNPRLRSPTRGYCLVSGLFEAPRGILTFETNPPGLREVQTVKVRAYF